MSHVAESSNLIDFQAQRLRRQRWVWQKTILAAPKDSLGLAAKVVAAALVGFFNEETGKAWPSHAALAKATSLSVRAVRYALDELEAAGFLLREGRAGGTYTADDGRRKGRTAEYRMALPDPVEHGTGVPPSNRSIRGTRASGYVAKTDRHTWHARATEPIESEPIEENQGSHPSRACALSRAKAVDPEPIEAPRPTGPVGCMQTPDQEQARRRIAFNASRLVGRPVEIPPDTLDALAAIVTRRPLLLHELDAALSAAGIHREHAS